MLADANIPFFAHGLLTPINLDPVHALKHLAPPHYLNLIQREAESVVPQTASVGDGPLPWDFDDLLQMLVVTLSSALAGVV